MIAASALPFDWPVPLEFTNPEQTINVSVVPQGLQTLEPLPIM